MNYFECFLFVICSSLSKGPCFTPTEHKWQNYCILYPDALRFGKLNNTRHLESLSFSQFHYDHHFRSLVLFAATEMCHFQMIYYVSWHYYIICDVKFLFSLVLTWHLWNKVCSQWNFKSVYSAFSNPIFSQQRHDVVLIVQTGHVIRQEI
jgi:hypothetical protein